MIVFFFLMVRRPPKATQSRSSAASDVYKRQNIVSWDPNSDGMLNQHIEGGAFADTVIQEQGNDQQ